MTPELTRPFAIDRMGEAARVTVEATAEERAAIARRLGIVDVGALDCRFALRRWEGATVQAEGSLTARVTQVCVVTTEAFDSEVREDFSVRFVPEGMESEEIDLDAPDEIPYAGSVIDLGEAAVEQLALALDAFPRKPGAALPSETVADEDNPFAALAAFRKKEGWGG
jgi:uncharacterized metal-binding protein YceD (DUF177 family)